MLKTLAREIRTQLDEVRAVVKTREFWIYFALISVLTGLLIALAYVATGFDELTRQQALIAIACRAGDTQLLTIIVGGIAFVLLSLFTLGEVVLWFEGVRRAKTSRLTHRASRWRPLAFVGGAIGLGVTGMVLLGYWCQ